MQVAEGGGEGWPEELRFSATSVTSVDEGDVGASHTFDYGAPPTQNLYLFLIETRGVGERASRS